MSQPRPRLTLLPTTISDVLHVGERGRGYCAQCQVETPYIGRQITITLPPVPFLLGGIAGVCTECDALVAMPPVLFQSLVSAWEHRGSDEARFVCTVRRPGEPPLEYRARLVEVAEVSGALAAELDCEVVTPAESAPGAPCAPGVPVAGARADDIPGGRGRRSAGAGGITLAPETTEASAPERAGLGALPAEGVLSYLPATEESTATRPAMFGVLKPTIQ